MKLIIVESPTKAKTIAKYLDKNYKVMASAGHVRDLPKSKLGVDTEKNFEPVYVVSEGKEATVKKIAAAAKKADEVIIATDLDREGEAIGYHVKYLIEEEIKTKKKPKFVRATFHEITKDAILDSIANPTDMNMALVDAQQARRVLDRLVGYKLSPVLWRKVRRGLSAGRVQSVTVKLIVEREKERDAFKPVEYWEIGSEVFKKGDKKDMFIVDLSKIDGKKAEVRNGKEAKEIISYLEKGKYKVEKVEKKELKSGPMPPFITSTMQRSASNLFGWSSRNTMRVAQQLYEKGFITYHRTDSVFLSKQALAMAKKYIQKEFGSQYLPEKTRVFKTKSKLAQEAHEAIRVTEAGRSLDLVAEACDNQAKKLYQLILNRFLASQMAVAVVAKTNVWVSCGKYELRASGEIQIFDGWRKVYGKSKEFKVLPDINEGDSLELSKVLSEQKFTQPPARYSESSLIKALEQKGIGRPSTYAPTISTIMARRYVEKENKSFYPTEIGKTVTEFLSKNFETIMDYDFTAEVEEDLDKIAVGDKKWQPVVGEIYKPLAVKIEDVIKNAERVKIKTEKTGNKCPDCGEGDEVIRVGRFGKFISCSRFPDCKYTKQYMETVDDMKCPDCKKGDVILRRTRKGRQFYGCSAYPKCKWASWSKPKEGEKFEKSTKKKTKAKTKKAKPKKSTAKKKSVAKKK